MRKIVFTDDQKENIINDYNNNISTTIIAEKYGTSKDTIIRYLKKENVYDPKRSKINRINNHKVAWTEDEKLYLMDNYGKINTTDIYDHFNKRHTIGAIKNMAWKLLEFKSKTWTQQEEEIIKKYYPILPMEEVLEMLPNRTKNSVICKADQLNVKGLSYISSSYSLEQKEFIKNNFGILSDVEISQILNKPLSGIQEQRRKMGLYYLNKDYSNYTNMVKLFRGHIHNWKNASMESCDYKCIFTGSKNFIIHHKYAFNMILKETFEKLYKEDLLKSEDINDYSFDELQHIIDIFTSIHDKYPLGVCIHPDIHDLFHRIYGSGSNTVDQWDDFEYKYRNGIYTLE